MRLIATVFLLMVLLTAANSKDCEAQLFRRFGRTQTPQAEIAPPILVKPVGLEGRYVPQDRLRPTVFPTKSYFEKRNSVIARLLDGPMTHKYRDPVEVDSRYIGGFHQSYFNNIGIPSGDIGLRGNAYNWRTW